MHYVTCCFDLEQRSLAEYIVKRLDISEIDLIKCIINRYFKFHVSQTYLKFRSIVHISAWKTRLIINKYRFEMIDARKRKRYRTRQFHIRQLINKIYIYKKKYENSMQGPCKGACRIEKRSSNAGERIYGSCDIAIIRRNLSSVYYEKKKNGFRPEPHEFIITITSRRSYLIAEVVIRIYLAICRDCLQIGGFLHVLLSFCGYA